MVFRAKVFCTVCVALLLNGAALAPAQDADPVVQLAALAERWASYGFRQTHQVRIGRLQNGQTDAYEVTLRAGVRYRIVGVCDRDCRDLDLALLDGQGDLIAADVNLDDLPVIEFTPWYTSRFALVFEMADCTREPCSVGVGVFGRTITRSDNDRFVFPEATPSPAGWHGPEPPAWNRARAGASVSPGMSRRSSGRAS